MYLITIVKNNIFLQFPPIPYSIFFAKTKKIENDTNIAIPCVPS